MADNKDSQDYLGYSTYAQTLWARIARALEKDAFGQKELGDDPLVVGIFGEWGAGKSKLLSLIQQHAKRDAEIKAGWRKMDEGNCTLTVPVFFQPWKYEHEEHLHVPILLHILSELKIWAEDAQTFNEACREAMPEAIKTHMGIVVAAVSSLIFGTAYAIDASVSMADKAKLAVAALGAKILKKSTEGKTESVAFDYEHQDNGRSFYELHQILKAITRPQKYAKNLIGVNLSTPVSINFVLFIDDLDRCLPEKAVETLELIKTIFNLESFAFVLALDEEVVERGIGHRYQSYVLKDKKPEMPITGFEYLEKIVHLPFRLPALTRAQAMGFVRRYEAELEKQESFRWFSAPLPSLAADESKPRTLISSEPGAQMDLLPLALGSFVHYVPRKLIRMVELMHGIAQVSRKPGYRDIERGYGGAIDPRIVLSLVLLQLFQPELYRAMRRQTDAFSLLLSAFVPNGQGETELSRTHVSDADLCQWVIGKGKALGDLPNESSKLIDHLSGQISKELTDESEQIRFNAQAVKLPLVAQLIAHRSIQRHSFDPIKLFQLLAADMQHSQHSPASVVLRPYLNLLAQKMQRNALETKSNWHSIHWVEPLVKDLVSAVPGVQANILSRHDIPEDAYLSQATSTELANQLAVWKSGNVTPDEMHRLLRGLYYLAPTIHPQYAKPLWDLADDMVRLPQLCGEALKNPQLAALWADVRDRLGLDERFDAIRPYLCDERYQENSEENEPLPGYVKIPRGAFLMGSEEDKDLNPPRLENIADDFYMARHLTTVRHYSEFVKANGYEDENWWDTQGWAWRRSQWQSKNNDYSSRVWLDWRTPEKRSQPMWWDQQVAHGNRPVYGINWFEARAYCRWLSAQLRLLKSDDKRNAFANWQTLVQKGYEARLPTEHQWERSARALKKEGADAGHYAWGKVGDHPEQMANIDRSEIGRSSVVGLFAPSELGLMDMHGSLWEWQDNLFGDSNLYKAWQRIDRITDRVQTTETSKTKGGKLLLTDENSQNSARPSLRGGAWSNNVAVVRASVRGCTLPDLYGDYVGFRVALTKAF